MATAESVKAKLQGLITSANAKTGKSDANLTDAVKTLLEGYGQGGGSSLPIEVATADEMNALLETAEIGSIYKYTGTTTDTYDSGYLYLVEKKVDFVSFRIEGKAYQAEAGMTWLDFAKSSYKNGMYFYCSGGTENVFWSSLSTKVIARSDGTAVIGNDYVINGEDYVSIESASS